MSEKIIKKDKTSDWGGDYSFLLQTIEGKISENLKNSGNQQDPLESPQNKFQKDLSAAKSKRKRISNDRYSIEAAKSFNLSFDDDEKLNSSTFSVDSQSLKKFAELDELKLINERLKEKIQTIEIENKVSSDEMVRQLNFLEDQNKRLKQESESRLEKYYEEKANSKAKIRELENKIIKIQSKKEEYVAPVVKYRSDSEVLEKLNEMSKIIKQKSEEARINFESKIQLEQKVLELQEQIRLLRSSTNVSDEKSLSINELKSKCNQLEYQLSKKSKDLEKMSIKFKNQSILEDQINSLNQKVKSYNNLMKNFATLESEFKSLKEEKKLWNDLFQPIVQDHDSLNDSFSHEEDKSGNNSSSRGLESISKNNFEVNPSKVYSILNNLQKKCSLLLNTQGDLERNLTDFRRQVLSAETRTQELEIMRLELIDRAEKAESKINFTTQQCKLYENEVQNLRSLLKTFDMEFKFGKPENTKMIDAKNKIINELRNDLDNCRKEAKSQLLKIEELQSTIESNKESKIIPSSNENFEEDPDEKFLYLKNQLDSLQEDYFALQQVSGMDYLPHKTKVLHFIDNPSKQIKKPQLSTLPLEENKRLRKENKTLLGASFKSNSNSELISPESSSDLAIHDADEPKKVENPSDALQNSIALAESNKLNQRLKEMFKERISSFREAVYLLTGYKIDFFSPDSSNPMPRIRLRSMYAEQEDDSLIFQLNGNNPELLETEFAKNLNPKFLEYLSKYNSVPVFLSSITTELFDNQTLL